MTSAILGNTLKFVYPYLGWQDQLPEAGPADPLMTERGPIEVVTSIQNNINPPIETYRQVVVPDFETAWERLTFQLGQRR